MGVKFKCKLSGNVYEFVNDFDIKDMREHPQYEEVLEESDDGLRIQKVKKTTKKEVTKEEV
jgi:hypothetical protein